MNDKCLNYEDMIELLTSERISDENRTRLFQINTHLLKCSSCGESYRKLAKLFDVVESWSLPGQYEAEQKLQHMKTCLALLRAQKTAAPSLVSRIDSWIKNFVDSSANISVKIRNGIKMTVDKACMFVDESTRMNFGYANLAAARGEPPKTDINLLIDKDNAENRIKIDGQRVIKISLAAVSDKAPLVAIIPHDTSLAATVVELSYDGEQKLWAAELCDLADGEYDLIIESAE